MSSRARVPPMPKMYVVDIGRGVQKAPTTGFLHFLVVAISIEMVRAGGRDVVLEMGGCDYTDIGVFGKVETVGERERFFDDAFESHC